MGCSIVSTPMSYEYLVKHLTLQQRLNIVYQQFGIDLNNSFRYLVHLYLLVLIGINWRYIQDCLIMITILYLSHLSHKSKELLRLRFCQGEKLMATYPNARFIQFWCWHIVISTDTFTFSIPHFTEQYSKVSSS